LEQFKRTIQKIKEKESNMSNNKKEKNVFEALIGSEFGKAINTDAIDNLSIEDLKKLEKALKNVK
tara:strand:- start:217 stop:411 length:195 start_codon:yes stop_codon:yes gene_type:complete